MQLIRKLFGKKRAPAAKPLESSRDATPHPTTKAWLFELFRRHGIVSTEHEDWVLPNGELPAIRGTWMPGETHGRLDMHVVVREGVLIEECFAGFGPAETGMADAFHSFTINSFHTLLSALWSQHDSEQVLIEKWNVGGREFSAFIGNVGTRSSSDVTPSIPQDLMQKLEAAIRSECLEQELHWFRFYVANVKGEFTFEALKDNEHWSAGVGALTSCSWAPSNSFYSARLFMVLRRMSAEAGSTTRE